MKNGRSYVKKGCCIIWFCFCLLFLGVVGKYQIIQVQAAAKTEKITIGKGKSYTVQQKLSGKAVYQTSDSKVAVAGKGKVTGKGFGTAKITIQDKGKVYVYKVKVSKIYLSRQNITLNAGDSATIKVKGTKCKAVWKSSNEKAVSVKNGKITAKRKGKSVVTAKVKGNVLKCMVVVKKRNTIYVSASAETKGANGSRKHPFSTIQEAVDHAEAGARIMIAEGTYEPFTVSENSSGTKKQVTTIKAEEGAHPVIQVPSGSKNEDTTGIYLENVSHICIEGLEISGGTHGIYYENNREAVSKDFDGITIRNCRVHDIDGEHGIAVYGRNDTVPITGIVIEGCEVYDCQCGSSESVVLNGNIDGFKIRRNVIHDNNNIGIDMIGFEGTAIHDKSYEGNRYDADFVRNGTCYGNTVFNISAQGNDAYLEDGEYCLCAGGIYVDGGQNIRIYNNEISNCDIGIEVATEHNPKKNPLFQVTGIEVYDNEIRKCTGFAGLAFGGYDGKRGFTVNCHFYRNTLVDNPVQIVVQRSKDNEIDHNTIIGGKVMIEYNGELPRKEMKNNFHDNIMKKSK